MSTRPTYLKQSDISFPLFTFNVLDSHTGGVGKTSELPLNRESVRSYLQTVKNNLVIIYTLDNNFLPYVNLFLGGRLNK